MPSRPATPEALPKGAFVGYLIASYRFVDPETSKLEEGLCAHARLRHHADHRRRRDRVEPVYKRISSWPITSNRT